MSKPRLIMSVGIPASGKTTYLKKFAETENAVYICPDDIREQLTGDAIDQSKNDEVWEIAHANMDTALSEGRTVVLDATRVRADYRLQDFAIAKNITLK